MTTARPTRSDRLLRVLADAERILLVMHDNPDPDAIAAGWALHVLIRRRLGRVARLVGGGDIVRAENMHMVALLEPPLELTSDLDIEDTAAAILVDCGRAAGNHLLAKEMVHPVAVIDHHDTSTPRGPRLPFRDVRPNVAAAASIAASYLREQGIDPDDRLATALYYAIRTETRGAQTKHSRLDRSIVRWLGEFVNPEWMAEIETAPLPRTYFTDLTHALANTTMYGDAAFCLLDRASSAEIVGEVADLLVRYDAVRSVFCAALVRGDLVVSVRTARNAADASQLVCATLDGLGGGGGHLHRAGGKVPAGRLAGRSGNALRQDLTRRWLNACGVEAGPGAPLVQR